MQIWDSQCDQIYPNILYATENIQLVLVYSYPFNLYHNNLKIFHHATKDLAHLLRDNIAHRGLDVSYIIKPLRKCLTDINTGQRNGNFFFPSSTPYQLHLATNLLSASVDFLVLDRSHKQNHTIVIIWDSNLAEWF